MTKKRALRILIQAGVNDITGSGLGYRNTSDEWRVTVSDAIRKLYKDAHGQEVDSGVEFNLQLKQKP